MGYRILFQTLDNDLAKETYEELKAQGHELYTATSSGEPGQIGEQLDLLILSIPNQGQSPEREKSGRETLDYGELLDTLDRNVNGILQTAQAAIPLLRRGELKRIALLTDQNASIRETAEEKDFAYHMSQAAANMILKILFNTYRPEGFTFRCFAGHCREGGMSPAEYLLTEQSYIETDDPIHSDENRLVMRDGFLREISW